MQVVAEQHVDEAVPRLMRKSCSFVPLAVGTSYHQIQLSLVTWKPVYLTVVFQTERLCRRGSDTCPVWHRLASSACGAFRQTAAQRKR